MAIFQKLILELKSISIKTHAYKWVEGSAFWDSPTLEIPTTKENEEALKLYKEGKGKQRQGV